MPLIPPSLDDRSFEDLYREARLRIPRYTPEWTDFNDSDPGITLLQLGAWLTEEMLYRLNRVPDRNALTLLALVGMEPEPATPARVQLVFTPTGKKRPGPVPAGAQVAGQPAGGGDPVVFETERELQPVAWPLTDVLVFDGAAFRDVTPLNQESGTGLRPLGWSPASGSALYLGFEPPDPLPATGAVFPREVRLCCFLPASATAGEPVRCGTPPPAPPVDLVWEYKRSAESRTWRRLNLLDDGSAAFTQDGEILVAGPPEGADLLEPFPLHTSEPRWWLRCRLRSGAYPPGAEPEIDFVRVNCVEAVSLQTRRDEVLGSGDGLPDLTLETRYRPLDAASLELVVVGADDEDEPWRRVDDLLACGEDDPCYTLDATAGTVTFGDGEYGRIPPAGQEVVARCYRHGGGAAANLDAGLVNAPMTPLTGIASVTNPRSAEGGKAAEKVEDLKRRAPSRLRHRGRAVSAADFAELATAAPGVERAHAVALAHPEHPGVKVPGAVTVFVVPDRGDNPRKPSAELLRAVCNYLDDVRLLTSEVYVQGPEYLSVEVRARLQVRPHAPFDRVARDAAAALDDYLDPLVRDFGEDLYPVRLLDVLLDAHVDLVTVEGLEVVVDGQPRPRDEQRIKVPAAGLLYGGAHLLVVEPVEED